MRKREREADRQTGRKRERGQVDGRTDRHRERERERERCLLIGGSNYRRAPSSVIAILSPDITLCG